MSTDCVFCEIIQRNLPASIVYENNSAICFLPKNMEVYGHTLVVPKEHFTDIYDISEATLAKLIKTTKKLALHYRRKIDATGVNILHASGKSAQQSIFHFHLHLLPRFDDDGLDAWPNLSNTEISHSAFLKRINPKELPNDFAG